MYSVQQQSHFNGNIFGNKCCRCNESSLYSLEAPFEALLMITHNITFSLRNKKKVNFQASKSWSDMWKLTIYLSVNKK